MLLKGKDFEPAPDGSHAAVCVDFIDLGLVKTEWQGVAKMKPKCRVVFEIDATMKTGSRYIVGATFTATLDSKGRLLPFLTSWRGKKFTQEELKGFDTEALVHVPALVQIVHVIKPDATYANIDSIMFPPKGMKRLEPSGVYVRVKDRQPVGVAASGQSDGAERDHDAPPPDDDDALPF